MFYFLRRNNQTPKCKDWQQLHPRRSLLFLYLCATRNTLKFSSTVRIFRMSQNLCCHALHILYMFCIALLCQDQYCCYRHISLFCLFCHIHTWFLYRNCSYRHVIDILSQKWTSYICKLLLTASR